MLCFCTRYVQTVGDDNVRTSNFHLMRYSSRTEEDYGLLRHVDANWGERYNKHARRLVRHTTNNNVDQVILRRANVRMTLDFIGALSATTSELSAQRFQIGEREYIVGAAAARLLAEAADVAVVRRATVEGWRLSDALRADTIDLEALKQAYLDVCARTIFYRER
jgi:hypothetical protein